jgi:hypothetical protein
MLKIILYTEHYELIYYLTSKNNEGIWGNPGGGYHNELILSNVQIGSTDFIKLTIPTLDLIFYRSGGLP